MNSYVLSTGPGSLVGGNRHSLIHGHAFGRFRVRTGVSSDDLEAGFGSLGRVRIVRASWNIDITVGSKFLERGVLSVRSKVAPLRVGNTEQVIANGSHIDRRLRSRADLGHRRCLPGVEISADRGNDHYHDESKRPAHSPSVVGGPGLSNFSVVV